jgi:hypothetical protein
VPELVEDHEDSEHDEERDDSGDWIHQAGKSDLEPRAGCRARLRIGSKGVVERARGARRHAIERLRTGRGDVGEANLPFENAATATSFAALRTAGAVPPAARA